MKNEFKISRLAIICVLCTAVSGAYAASSVRSLGGTGTYTSASSAAEANAGSGGSSSSVRGGSVRVTPSSGVSGTSTKVNAGTTTSGRVATTPRLSIGQYLGGATSVSGGSSLRPQTPSGGSSSGGDGSVDTGELEELRDQVGRLEDEVGALRGVTEDVSDQLLNKQDSLIPVDDGYISIDDNTNEIFINVIPLQEALEEAIGENVKIELDANETDVLWRHAGDSNWQVLISKAEITGPQGPQGEKGEPGDAADLGAYSTTEEMNLAIDMAVADVANKYATKEELTAATAGLVTSDDLKRGLQAKADAADVYTKEEVYNKQEVDEKVSDLVGVDMADYVKTEDFNNALGTKADTSYVDAQLANKADVGTVSGLAADVAEAKDLAAGAAIDAANAVGGLATKADTSYVNTQLDTKADKSELGNYAKTSDLAGYATTEQLETKADKSELLNYATTDSVDTKLENYYTISEVDDKVANIVAGDISEALVGKEDVSNKTQTVVDDETKYPSSAAVYRELETKAFKTDLDAKADKAELAGYATTEQLDAKADKSELANYATTEQLSAKADKAELEGYAKTSDLAGFATTEQLDAKADKTAVQQLQATVGNEEAGLVADVAKVDASLALKQDVSAREAKTITDDETKYPSSAAVTAALGTKADKTELENYVTDEELAGAGYVTSDDVDAAIEGAGVVTNDTLTTTLEGYVTDGELAQQLEVKADKATTYTKDEVDEMVKNIGEVGSGEIASELAKKQDKQIGSQYSGNILVVGVDGNISNVESIDSSKVNGLGTLAAKNDISNADIAADAGIEKTKLSEDVQNTLDNAVTMSGAGENKILGTDENGDKVWYTIAM